MNSRDNYTTASKMKITVMSLNMWQWYLAIHHGTEKSAQFIADAVLAAGADVTGIQESNADMVRAAASLLGYHVNVKQGTDLSLISKYPIIELNEQNDYYLIELEPGKAVTVCNVHLSHEPYGPYDIADGMSAEEVMEREHLYHMKEMNSTFRKLPALASQNMPVFLTGDFNVASHLDWTEERKEIHYGQAVEWPVSKRLEELGLLDSFRVMYPDPVAVPGITWAIEGTEMRDPEVYDRIDFVYAGGPATTVDSKVVGEKKAEGVQPCPSHLPLKTWLSDHRAVASTFLVTPRSYRDLVLPE